MNLQQLNSDTQKYTSGTESHVLPLTTYLALSKVL